MYPEANHPAVLHAADKIQYDMSIHLNPNYTGRRREALYIFWVRRIIMFALPHLTADDLRNTPAGKALIQEGKNSNNDLDSP